MRIRDIFSATKDIPPLDLINIVSYALALSKEGTLSSPDREVEEKDILCIGKLIYDRKAGRPLAYILKNKEFFSEEFFVDERVLVPRPDTELLVEEALKIIEKKRKPVYALDMGCGSGAVGITLAKQALCNMVCVDISTDALGVARQNARTLGVNNRVTLVCSDLFGGIKEGARFDVILANLPYVSGQEWDGLAVDVRGFEPRIALDGGEQGMEVYEAFLSALNGHLKADGHVLCEIGSARQATTMRTILESRGLAVAVKRDLSGSERVVVGSWKNS